MQTVVRNHVSETLQKMDVALVATINGKMAESEALLHELSKIQVIPAHQLRPDSNVSWLLYKTKTIDWNYGYKKTRFFHTQ